MKTKMWKAVMLSVFTINNLSAQPLSLEWAKNISGAGSEVGKSIAIDASGNVYTAGYFTGTVDFDPGVNAFFMSSLGQQDIFIEKMDANGNFLWAKRIGGYGNDAANAVATDAAGNVYTTGFYHSTADFNPGVGTAYLTCATLGSQDIFISKLDANGNFVWAKSMGGTGYYDILGNLVDGVSVGYSIKVDGTGNIYTTGSFLGNIDFNPNAGLFQMAAMYVSKIYVSKLNASGNFVWAKSAGENVNGSEAYGLSLDALGNVYTTGVFAGTVDFDPNSGTSFLSCLGNWMFVWKLDGSGNFVWAKSVGGVSSNDQTTGFSVAVDAAENVYVAGNFKGSADFGNSISMNAVGNTDIFIAKFDNNGDVLWAKQTGGTNHEYCYALSLDVSGNVYTTGSFKGRLDFDPGSGAWRLGSSTTGGAEIFVSKLNTNGDFMWAYKMGGPLNDQGNAILVSPAGNIYMTGYFSSTADFDPNVGVANLISAGGVDAFVLRMNQQNVFAPTPIETEEQIEVRQQNTDIIKSENEEIEIFPNPSNGILNINFPESLHDGMLYVLDSKGQIVFQQNIQSEVITCNLSHLANGNYFMKVVDMRLKEKQKNHTEYIKRIQLFK